MMAFSVPGRKAITISVSKRTSQGFACIRGWATIPVGDSGVVTGRFLRLRIVVPGPAN